MAQITVTVPDKHVSRLLGALVGLFGSQLPPEANSDEGPPWNQVKKAKYLHRQLLLQQVYRWEKSQAVRTHVDPIVIDERVIEPIE